MAQPQKLKVTQTSTKAQAAGFGAGGAGLLVTAIVQFFQIQLTPEQLSALVTITSSLAAFAAAWSATNSPVVQDADQSDAAIPVEPVNVRADRALSEQQLTPDEVAALKAIVSPAKPVASVPTAVVDPSRKAG